MLEDPILSESILQRLAVQGPRYTSLWFDSTIVDHGPSSYFGPPRLLRFQSWYSPSQSLALIGDINGLPQAVYLRLDGGAYTAQPALDDPWFSEWRIVEGYNSPFRELLTRTASLIFDTNELERGFTFNGIGREIQAGTKTLVVDVLDRDQRRTDRIWYDESRGLILRRITYPYQDYDLPAYEISIEQVDYDVAFPQDLFDPRLPWRGGFASDFQGSPASINVKPVGAYNVRGRMKKNQPPAGFDPASSRLTFQFTPSFSVDAPAGWIELFADAYFIGELRFGNPWQSICDRSPDGSWLAFVSKPVHQDDSNSFLKWFSLRQPETNLATLGTHFGVSEFAFSPDTSQIAYFSRPSRRGLGTLGIVDTATQRDQPLLAIGDVKSIVWNPEGGSFAMIARYQATGYDDYVAVYDLNQDKITYNTPVDYESNSVQDWPMTDWGVEFPVEMGGMDACSLPPKAK